MPRIATLKLTSDTHVVTQAQAWLEQAATDHQWPSRTVFALQLSMDEALTNILMHGFAPGLPRDACIVLHLSSDAAFVTLEIIDNGPAFDPTQKTPDQQAASLDDAIPGGHGLRLMRHYLHDIRHTFIDGHNHLRLIARLDVPADGA